MRFNICSITNEGNFVFDELIDSYASAIRNLGNEVLVSRNNIVGFVTNIIIGAHQKAELPPLPKNTIICNTEQIIDGSWWLTDRYIDLLKQHTVWDYSKFNVERLKKDFGLRNVHYAGLGYSEDLVRIKPAPVKDIDVLFYGSISERRAVILRKLFDEKINFVPLYGAYGSERDEYIARSKIVLNIHFFKECYFEPIRVGYLLNNGVFVISEESSNKEDENVMADCIAVCPYDKLVEKCMYYLAHEEERQAIINKIPSTYGKHTQEKVLRPLINELTRIKVVTI